MNFVHPPANAANGPHVARLPFAGYTRRILWLFAVSRVNKARKARIRTSVLIDPQMIRLAVDPFANHVGARSALGGVRCGACRIPEETDRAWIVGGRPLATSDGGKGKQYRMWTLQR